MLIGIDIASVARVAELRARRPRFVERVYTASEVARCGTSDARWAARWAAKEAVRKLAGAAALPLPDFREIDVVSDSAGAPHAEVRGWAAPVALSLTHDAGLAVAVAVAADTPAALPTVTRLRLPDRPPEGHKGTFGTVVVAGGSQEFSGAPYLAAMGAARGGAGLVRAGVPETIWAVVASKCVEVMAFTLPESGGGMAAGAFEALGERLEKADAFVIGCGLGRAGGTAEFVEAALTRSRVPLVADADALNLSAERDFDWKRCAVPVIVTPHPAEMARLAKLTTEQVQADRVAVARDFALRAGVVVVLKGAHTVVVAPDGRTHTDPTATPALATGGSGDVLAGLCGSMVAQGLDSFDAAVAAVTIHAHAGLLLQARFGRAGGLASDLFDLLPRAQESLRRALERAR